MSSLRRTPLFDEHVRLNAKMAPFSGWEMPIQYGGIIEETEFCRKSVCLFDTGHMGEFYFKGDIAESGIERAFCFSIEAIPVGRCKYGFILNDKGGIVDDLIVYRLSDDELMIVVNAGTIENDFDTIRSVLKPGYTFENRSGLMTKLDVQGPKSAEVLKDLFGVDVSGLKYFRFQNETIQGKNVAVSRTGYTGELGFELYTSAENISKIWQTLLADSRVKPAGLGARDILRLEMGYPLYGSDIDEQTTPLEADFAAFVDFRKDFRGKDALLAQQKKGVDRVRVAFRSDSRRSPGLITRSRPWTIPSGASRAGLIRLTSVTASAWATSTSTTANAAPASLLPTVRSR
jgi:aminomethyltransferase